MDKIAKKNISSIKIFNEHWKIYSVSLVISELPTESTMRCYAPLRKVKIYL